jgi:hypothetical protein
MPAQTSLPECCDLLGVNSQDGVSSEQSEVLFHPLVGLSVHVVSVCHAYFAPHVCNQSYERMLEHYQRTTLPFIVPERLAVYLP